MCLGERPLKEPMDDKAGAHPMSNVWHIYRLSHEQNLQLSMKMVA